MRRPYRLIASLFALGLVSASASAEDAWPTRVGRISLAETGTTIRSGTGLWLDAIVNEPVGAGYAVRTGADGRAEVRLAGTALTLAPATEIELVRFDDDSVMIALRQGRIGVRRDPRGQAQTIEIDTAWGAIWPSDPGHYDIAAGAADAAARIAAFIGTALVAGPGIDASVAAGTAASLTGAAPVVIATEPATADGFAEWSRARGADAAESEPPRHVPAAMTGAAALAANGKWDDSAEFGSVWYPNAVPDGWAPFRYGSWRFLPPWGWTWIDGAAWGFAPSHYGRWVRIPGSSPDTDRWGWLPGAGEPNPAYLPAVVAFLGTPAVGLSYAGGLGPAIAWFPLGPGEIYWPGHPQDAAAIRRINAGSAADLFALAPGPDGGAPAAIVNGPYRNRRFASAVPRAVFVDGRPVAPALVQIPEDRLEQAPLIPGAPQIGPPPPRPPGPIRPLAVVKAAVAPHRAATAVSSVHARAVAAPPRERARLRMSLRRPAKPALRLSPLVNLPALPDLRLRDFAAARHLIPQ